MAQPQAAPAALPALTSWRKGPAAVQPPRSHAEGPSHLRLRRDSAYAHWRCLSTGCTPIDCHILEPMGYRCLLNLMYDLLQGVP